MSKDEKKEYVIYSPNESAISDEAGYWSSESGWTSLEYATRFSHEETLTMPLPPCAGSDAIWAIRKSEEEYLRETKVREAHR